MLAKELLEPYQHNLISHIKKHPFSALFVGMGLGKTVSTLTAISDLLDSFDVHKTLVIAPLRVARKTWQDEINTWEHVSHLTVSKILETPAKRLAGISAEADIYVINRENVEWLVDQFLDPRGKLVQEWPWGNVIIDESSSFKNHRSNRWRALKRIRKHIDRATLLTGTPRPKGLMDLWSQVFLLDGGERLGKNITAFRNRWFDPPGYGFEWKPKDHAERQITAAIRDVCVSMKAEDFLDMKPTKINPIKVELSHEQFSQYKELEKHNILELQGEEVITAVNAGVLAGKLLQLANGAYYTDNPEWEEFHTAKLDALVELLEFVEGPAIVCYNFKFDAIRIQKRLKKKKIKFDMLTDEASEDRWNAGKTPVLLLHPKSAGHGLNLHKCGSSDIIWFGLTYSLEDYQQANARLMGGHRRGDRTVVMHMIIAENTIDERVIEVLEEKDEGQKTLISALRNYIGEEI